MATREELRGSGVTTSYRITPVDWSDTTVASVVDALDALPGVLRITTLRGD